MEELEMAVTLALDPSTPTEAKLKATTYCDQVKKSRDSWIPCLSLFLNSDSRKSEVRFFALQILEETVRQQYNSLNESQKIELKTSLWNYVSSSNLIITDPVFLRTKLCLLIVLLFKREFPTRWPTFFQELAQIVQASIGTVRESTIIDLFLKICSAIDEEVVCRLVTRTDQETALNTSTKDAIRDYGMNILSQLWLMICSSQKQKKQSSLVNECLRIMGMYISWTDIQLYLKQEFMTLLFQSCIEEVYRMAATECVAEIIGKGMNPEEKMDLLQSWKMYDLMQQLTLDDEDFKEQVARILNSLALELIKVFESTENLKLKDQVLLHLIELLPRILALLADEYDDTSTQLFGFLSGYVSLLKKLKKENKLQLIPANLQNYNQSLFRIILVKMKYDEDSYESEDEPYFLDMRRSLKAHFIVLLNLQKDVFETVLFQLIESTLSHFKSNSSINASSPSSITPPQISWTEVELILHLLFIYAEATKGVVCFFDDQGVAQPIALIFEKVISDGVSAYPHPAVHCVYFDLLSRYTSFFEMQSKFIPFALMSFIDKRGLHNSVSFVRAKACYLFLRFVKQLRQKIIPFIDDVLLGLQDSLVVQKPTEQDLKNAKEDSLSASYFDSQLYLFEAVGILISNENLLELKQIDYLRAITQPILHELQSVFQQGLYKSDLPPDHIPYTQYLSRLILAIGELSKGFPDYDIVRKMKKGNQMDILAIFKQILNGIIVILEQLNAYQVIREATRFTFQRMVGCMGPEMLAYVHPLVKAGVLPQGSIKEMIDFLNFFGLIIHRYRKDVFYTVNTLLLPLLEKIFFILNQTPTGTDDAIQLIEMRKAYLNLLAAIFNSELEGVFTSNENINQMTVILQSIIHYVQDTSDDYAQKLAFSILCKTILVWGGVSADYSQSLEISSFLTKMTTSKALTKKELMDQSNHFKPKPALPGFDQFIFDVIIPMVFRIPIQLSVDGTKAGEMDGQTLLLLNETANILKCLLISQGQRLTKFLPSYLSSLQWPQQSIQTFMELFVSMEVKQLVKFFKSALPSY